MRRMGLEGELGWVGVLPRHEVAHPGDVIPLGKTEYRNTSISISRIFYQRHLHNEGAIKRVLAC